MKKKKSISDRELDKVVARSSSLEGYSFEKAKKNIRLIKLLQKHGPHSRYDAPDEEKDLLLKNKLCLLI